MSELVGGTRPLRHVHISGIDAVFSVDNNCKQIGIVPSSFLGFYTLIVEVDDKTTRCFLVSPSTIVIELGDEIKQSGLVVAQGKIPNDITKKA